MPRSAALIAPAPVAEPRAPVAVPGHVGAYSGRTEHPRTGETTMTTTLFTKSEALAATAVIAGEGTPL